VPVELTERAIRDVIAVMGEWDDAQAAESALNWMGWEGEGPLLLRRYDVQLFVWYTLPRKFLTSLEHKREAAEALALTLERLGGRAASYAEVCRSTETEELLRAWESKDPTARRRLRELLEGSGIEPPDTELLAWGSVMGFEEACVREQVATTLEEAVEDGRLSPGTPGFRRRQAQVADAALSEPAKDSGVRTRLQVVHAERVQRRGKTIDARRERARNRKRHHFFMGAGHAGGPRIIAAMTGVHRDDDAVLALGRMRCAHAAGQFRRRSRRCSHGRPRG